MSRTVNREETVSARNSPMKISTLLAKLSGKKLIFKGGILAVAVTIIWAAWFLATPTAIGVAREAKLPTLYKAPEFKGLTNWMNTQPIESMESLRGKVVLIDFWTYSCINCINTLPYVKKWHKKYADKGLVVIGVHAPEFKFERIPKNVVKAVEDYKLHYPIVMDNGFKLWRAYRNRYWPAKYLIDKNGVVRYTHFGEGRYKETEAAIVALLQTP